MTSAITAMTLAILVLGLTTSAWMRRQSSDRTPTSLDDLPQEARVVVLGCPARARSGESNRYFVARIEAAAAAYHYHSSGDGSSSAKPTRILCSGWDGEGEAEAMAEALIAAGVSPDAIRVDGRAARTVDSVDYVTTHHACEPIVFVSQAFHLPRVLFLARGRGLDAWGLAARGEVNGLRARLREALARLRAIVDLAHRSIGDGPQR